jgi:hypothetical protein
VSVPLDKLTPRGRCYHALGHVFNEAMVQYYLEHPHLLRERDIEQLKTDNYATMKLLKTVLAKLDEFAIEELPSP